jgi:cell wall-associated NlpC family hydrolase
MAGWGDALVHAAPSVKAPAAALLPMGARVAAAPHDADWWRLDAGYVHRRQLLPADGAAGADWVAAAYHFLGAPYKWGGRSRTGIDCSGLVQVALGLAGIRIGRDSDMQAATTAPAPAPGRGVLAFWPGHVGVLVDERHLLHANAHWMMTVVEPLAAAEARAGASAELRRP